MGEGGGDCNVHPPNQHPVATLSLLHGCSSGPDGDTALHLSCLYGHLECARVLLDAGADADVVNEEDGSTALHDAAAGGYLEVREDHHHHHGSRSA